MGHQITESTDKICGAVKADPRSHAGSTKGEGWVCNKPEDHDPPHKDMFSGRTWT